MKNSYFTLLEKLLLITAVLACWHVHTQTGSIDTSFNTADNGTYMKYIGGSYMSDAVVSGGAPAVLQPDGKILVLYGGQYSTVKRLNANGTLDGSFTFSGVNQDYRKIFLQPDNKFLLVSYNGYVITRYNANGTPDATFTAPNLSEQSGGAGDQINDIKFTPEGKLYVIGNFTKVNNAVQKFIVRLNSNGTVDTSFNPGLSFDYQPYAIAIMPNGKILAGGPFEKYNNVSKKYFLRINTDGSLDTTLTFPSSSYFYAQVWGIEILPNGKIMVCGSGELYRHNNFFRRGIIRLNADFTYDTTFNTSGFLGTQSGMVYCMKPLPDGKVVIYTAPNDDTQNSFYRLNADGTKDTTFNNLLISDNITNILLQPDGKFLIPESYKSATGITRNGIHRMNADGSLDYTFNPMTSANAPIKNTCVLPGGKVIISGNFTAYTDNPAKNVARLNADGTFDNTFTLDPSIYLYSNENIRIKPVADSKYLMAADMNVSSNIRGLVRLNNSGSIDQTFTDGLAGDRVTDLAIYSNHEIITTGNSSSFVVNGKYKLVKLNADGSVNPGYSAFAFDSPPVSLEIQPDNKLLVAGDFYSYNNQVIPALVRLNPNGTLDTSFNINIPGNYVDKVYKTLTLPDGKILVSFKDGNSNRFKIARLNPNGSADTGFFINSGVSLKPYMSFFLLSDGRVILPHTDGNFNNINASDRAALLLNADGTWDSSWYVKRAQVYRFDSEYVNDLMETQIAVQSCGKLLLYGEFQGYNNAPKHFIARINITNNPNMPAGSSTQTFTPGETLADLDVTGQNVQWYSTPSTCTVLYSNRSVTENDMPLALSTPLINGVTYYATQTVSGLESLDRLAVTANTALGIDDNTISKMKLYPNPANSFVTISNDTAIDEIIIYNIHGQKIKSERYTTTEAHINIDSLTNGLYLFTIQSGNRSQTFKVLKN
jgi:uncharacterized delta-60 repeat protein